MDRAETSKNHSIGFSSFQKIIYKVSVRSFHIWRSTVECILACILPNNTDSGFGIQDAKTHSITFPSEIQGQSQQSLIVGFFANTGVARWSSNFASGSENDVRKPNGSCGGRCVTQPSPKPNEAVCRGSAVRADMKDSKIGGYSGEPLLCKLRPVS